MELTDQVTPEIASNAAYQNILTRTSVRKYTDAKVPDEIVSALLHAAMAAPSGVNKQPWEFIVVENREMLMHLAEVLPYAKMAAEAPLAIVVCGSEERMLPGVDGTLWEQDCSAASENILLAAHALGLGGVWTCLYPHEDRIEAAKRVLSLSDELIPFNLIPIGHPEREHAPMNKWHPERVHIIS